MNNIVSSQKFTWVLVAFFLVIALQFTFSNFKALKTPAYDFEVFYLAGQQLVTNQNPYLKIKNDVPRQPPPAIFLFAVLPTFTLLQSQVIWFLLSLISFLIGSYFLFRFLEIIDQTNTAFSRNIKVWLVYLSLSLTFFPFRFTLSSGQVGNLLFLTLCLMLYFLALKKNFLTGLFFCLSIFLKISPLFLAYELLLHRKIKLLLLTLVCLAVSSVITIAVFGFQIYSNYLNVPSSFFDFSLATYYNQSLVGFLARISSNQTLNQLVYFFSLTIGLIWLFFIHQKNRNNETTELLLLNINFVYMLIFAPFAWQHHFVVMIIPLVLATYFAYKLKTGFWFFLLLYLAYLMIGWNIKSPETFKGLGVLTPFILSHYLWGCLLLICLNYQLLSFRNKA